MASTTIDGAKETYSYYGALNYVCWSVGYHNEHQDVPLRPGGDSQKSSASLVPRSKRRRCLNVAR